MFDINKILKKKKSNNKFTDTKMSDIFGENIISNSIGKLTNKPLKNMGASVKKQNQWKNFSHQKRNKMRKKHKDTDGDRVPDMWDCSPLNIMKQDWKTPEGFSSEGVDKYGRKIVYVPVEEAYQMRGRYGKADETKYIVDSDYKNEKELKSIGYNKKWEQDFKTLYEKYGDFDKAWQEAEKIKEEDMIKYNAEIKKKALEKEGYNVYPYKIGKTKRQYISGDKKGATLRYRAKPKQYRQMVEGVMQPSNISEGTSSGDRTSKRVENYYGELKKELSEGEVPMVEASDRDIKRGVIGEGRHRILAARELGMKQFPIVVDERTGERMKKYPQGLDTSKHKPNPEKAWKKPEFDEESYRSREGTEKYKEEAKKEVQEQYENHEFPENKEKNNDIIDEETRLLILKNEILNDSDNDGLLDVADGKP